jgi:hypothetical protein
MPEVTPADLATLFASPPAPAPDAAPTITPADLAAAFAPAAAAPAAAAPAAAAPAGPMDWRDRIGNAAHNLGSTFFSSVTPGEVADPALQAALEKSNADLGVPDWWRRIFGAGSADAAAAAEKQAAADKAAREKILEGADSSSGAPAWVRAVVGAAPSEADRLATLRQYYPDAQPLPGTENFVFTDPASPPDKPRKMTYAPIGMRVPTDGDFASLGGDIAAGVGGAGGAALGAAIGGGPVGGWVTGPLGGGMGAVAALEGYRGLLNRIAPAPSVDTRTIDQALLDDLISGGVQTALPVAGKLFGPVAGDLLRPLVPGTTVRTAAQALEDSGRVPDLLGKVPGAVLAESPGWQKVEQTVMATPGGGPMRRAYTDTREALETGVQGVAKDAAGTAAVPDAATFASTIGDIAKKADAVFDTAREAADTQAVNLIGAKTPVDLSRLRALRAQFQQEITDSNGLAAPQYTDAIKQIDAILNADPRAGFAPFDTLRQRRTFVGTLSDFSRDPTTQIPKVGVPAVQQVYQTIKQSLMDAANGVSPEAGAALAEHDAMVAAYRPRTGGGPSETFEKLMDSGTRADAVLKLTQSTRPEDQLATKWLVDPAYTTPAQQAQVRAGLINQMGIKPDGEFDMATWARNYGRMQPPQKALLFGPGGLSDDLDNLATVQGGMRQSGTQANFSGTAATAATLAALSKMAGADPFTAAGVGAAAFGSPYLAARLMTSGPFVRWLSGAGAVGGSNWGEHVARLGAVAAADPSISPLIDQLRAALPATLTAPHPSTMGHSNPPLRP